MKTGHLFAPTRLIAEKSHHLWFCFKGSNIAILAQVRDDIFAPNDGAAHRWEGLPARPRVEAIQEDYTLLRTDRNGWIELSTDGERLWVEVERR